MFGIYWREVGYSLVEQHYDLGKETTNEQPTSLRSVSTFAATHYSRPNKKSYEKGRRARHDHVVTV
jgi:hypothetical protein